MQYSVYRKLIVGFELLGETRYLTDAEAIYKNWAEAYIAAGGDIIIHKGFEL